MPRMRKKKNFEKRMSACQSVHIKEPEKNKGVWRQKLGFSQDTPIYLELGCGKGQFAAMLAMRYSDCLIIAIEREPTAALMAMEKAVRKNLKNLFFIAGDINFIHDYFDANEADRIYLNFSDPWIRQNKPKRRLTYREYLDIYQRILKPHSDLFFKTDNDMLFDFSLEEIEASTFEIVDITRDLHGSKWADQNIQTEFEMKYIDQGLKIKSLHARNSNN